MSDERTDAALSRVLAELDDPSLFDEPVSPAAVCQEERHYRETLGLLAAACEPMPLCDGVRRRVLEAVAETAVAPARDTPAVASPTAPRLAPRQGWAGRLAAALAVATVALAALSLWLAAELRRDRRELAELRRDGATAERTAIALAEVRAELAVARRQVQKVSFGAEVCPLRPPADGGILPAARGVLLIAEGRAGWLLTAEGLAAERPGQVFQLWFRIAGSQQAVPGMAFSAPNAESLEVSSEDMPEDADAVFVTLEDEEGMPEPRGPIVLYGDDAMRIL